MTTIIQCDQLSKRFRLGLAPSFDRVTELLQHGMTGLYRKLSGRAGSEESDRYFWALRDVSFEITEGEVVGLIGRNGAGKSTLLKVLSRITRPTSGRIATRGRIASLLEVGAGFHPELTGRENIYLNGSILGMSRREIEVKFDRIVDFAEVEKFLDTPVKRYSSGMYTRLAFSVAAFLEPEILIVDEVLAVGDAEFQQKCLSKMDSVARSGRTVLFVSHNLKAVRSLCSRGLLLRQGQLVCDADVDQCLSEYRRWAVNQDLVPEFNAPNHPGYRTLRIALQNHQSGVLPFGSPLKVHATLEPRFDSRQLKLLFRLRDLYGNLVFHGDNGQMNRGRERWSSQAKEDLGRQDTPGQGPVSGSSFVGTQAILAADQTTEIEIDLGVVPLLPGRYSLEWNLADAETHALAAQCELTFDAEASPEAQMADTLASDLSSLYWPADFQR